MDYELDMTQVIHAPEEPEDDDCQVQAVLKVQLEDAPAQFQTFILKPGVSVVGRCQTCDIRINKSGVSKKHAQIELSKSDIIITDLGSQNGVKIGKRTLQPHVMYSLDYNMEFSVAGLKAWVLHDEENVAGGDTDSDTCSESLLTAVEVAQDQAGVEAPFTVSEPSALACDSAKGPGNLASSPGPSTCSVVGKATTSSQDAHACNNSTTQSSGSFTLPEMPNLDFTQTGSSEETQPCGHDSETKFSNGATEAAAPSTSVARGTTTTVASDKDALVCTPVQEFPSSTQQGRPGNASARGVEASKADELNAQMQRFSDTAALICASAGQLTASARASADGTECPDTHFQACAEVTNDATDEEDRLNAPTQRFGNDSIAALDAADATDEEDRLNAPTQGFGNDSVAGLDAADATDEEYRLNAPTQGFGNDSVAVLDGADATDEMDRLNAPTQGFGNDSIAVLNVAGATNEVDRLNAPTQRFGNDSVAVLNVAGATDEVDRLNAPTQGCEDSIAVVDVADEEDSLNAATQSYADGAECSEEPHSRYDKVANAGVDEMVRLNAPTQGLTGNTAGCLNAPMLAQAAYTSLDEQERLNAVTQSIDENNHDYDINTEDNLCGPTQPEDRPRRLLSGPCDLSFVLCEASQPCRDDEDDNEDCCPPTQKDISPPLKVHALLRRSKEKRCASAGDDDDGKTPPLSPKTTVDETPPPSPGFVAESDLEDNNVSMVTARHSLSPVTAGDATLYEDCATPGSGIGSPVIRLLGRVSTKRLRSGMSLREKPSCDTGVELQETAAAGHELESTSSGAFRKLDYSKKARAGDRDSSTAKSRGTSAVTWLEKDGQEAAKPLPHASCNLPSPAKLRPCPESADNNEKAHDAPYLHMSEIEGLDVPATEEVGSSESCQRSITLEEAKNTAEGCAESNKVVDNSGSPASSKTPMQPCSHIEVPKKDVSAKVSSDIEEESEMDSRRKGKRKQTVSKTSRTGKQATESNVENVTAEAAGAPARRSSGRRNAGSRMKSLLSLEKRTSTRGDFHENGISQEVSDKQEALHDITKKAQDKAFKRGPRRRQKGTDTVKDKQEMAPSPCREYSPVASWHEKDVEESLLKSSCRKPVEGASVCAQRSPVAEQDEERMRNEASVVSSKDKCVEDNVKVPSSPLLQCKLSTGINIGFSDPFTPFSQILADCLPTAEDEKTELFEAQRQTTVETAVCEGEATSSSIHSEQESVAESCLQASRSIQNSSDGAGTRKIKKPTAKRALTRRKATRGSIRESSLQPAQVLAEDTPSEVEELEKAQSPAQWQPTTVAKHGRLTRNRAARKAAFEFEALDTIPETEGPEGGSQTDTLSAKPVEDIDEKPSEAAETSDSSQGDEAVSYTRLSKTSRRGVKRTAEAAQPVADTVASTTGEKGQKDSAAFQPGKRGTKMCLTHRNSESQNESTDVSLKSDLESISSLSPQGSRQGRRGKKLSQEQTSMAHSTEFEDVPMMCASPQHEPKPARGSARRGRGTMETQALNLPADDAESTLTNSCTETESQDSKTSRHRGKVPALLQEKGDKTMLSTRGNVGEESCVEHQLKETAGYLHGRKGTRQRLERRGLPVADTWTESVLESDNTATDGEGTLPLSVSTRLSQKERDEKSSKVDVVKEISGSPEPQVTRNSQRTRSASHSQGSKVPSEQAATAAPVKRPFKTEPASPGTSFQLSSTSTQQGQSQDTGRRGKRNAAKVSSKAKQEIVESELEVPVRPTIEPPQKRPSRRQASKMPAPAKAPVTRKRDVQLLEKQEPAPLTSATSMVEALAEASLSCSPPKVTRRKRHVASLSFGEGRQDSDSETVGNEEQILEEMQIKSEPKSRRRALAEELAIKQELVEAPTAKRRKRRGNSPDIVPIEPQRSRSQERANMNTLSIGTAKTLKRKLKVLFTGIACTNEEEQVVRELGGAVATTASACTHLVTDKFRRTVKSLCCIGKGTPIVAMAWIKKCQGANAFVDHTPYLLQDKKAEKSLNFSLSDTLAKAVAHGGVLRGWSVHATAHVQPSPADMKEIVTCAGGKYLDAMPTRSTTSGNTVIVSCKDDSKACARARNNGVPIVSAEFILSGLLQYKVDIDTHRLS